MADKPRNIRNICILAHVDHGKTTFADHLIAGTGTGVVHPKLAGRLRFMDYLDEEQRRAITMKSSSIALHYKDHSINRIDSPGHMDFCSEVSTAARLSDRALVLVDAVEGVHIQTHAVLRQAWIEKLTPCLVLNKINRLISELKLSPMEAYTRLVRIVHEVNWIVSAYKSEKYLSDVDAILSGPAVDVGSDQNLSLLDVEDDEEDTFQPQKGNVAFVCALDGWGFCINEFAEIYSSRFGVSAAALTKALWGPRYFNPKTKMIVGKKGFVLEPLWQVYQAALDEDGVFNLNVPPRELQNKDQKVVLQAVMSRWLPLSGAVLSMVVRCMPDPVAAQAFRIGRLLPKRQVMKAELVRKSVEACNSSPQAPCVAFVSKMFAVPMKVLPQRGLDGEIENNISDEGELNECFLAFARIFSGVLYSGQNIYVLSALYDPLKGESVKKHMQVAELKSLYLMMGQGLTHVASVHAGNLVAIRGLGQHRKTIAPTLRVAIEPTHPADMGALTKGLWLLNWADPFVGVTVFDRGENVLSAAGEVHLERCVKDLKERFARVSLEVSPPLVSYKETIEGNVGDKLENLKFFRSSSDYVEKKTAYSRCTIKVQVIKHPPSLTKVLEDSSDLLGDILGGRASQINKKDENPIEALKKRIMDAVESGILSRGDADKDRVEKCKLKWQKLLKRIWALGPSQVDLKGKGSDGSVLICGSSHVSQKLGFVDASGSGNIAANTSSEVAQALSVEAESLESSVVSGFQVATAAGPLCDEPMPGEASHHQPEQYGIFRGQVMTTIKDACREAVLQKKPRLVEAMYFCELNTSTEHLSSIVLKEEMQEGSPLFTVFAYVPVSESFGFADELRRWTAGAASALLVLSHWEALPEDPFFVPKTEEELEEFDDGSSVLPNTARKLINTVRRKKGLPVEEKVVQHATRQRTLAHKV
ncbi:unnamed protein product [Malus baccata var. baccata]